MSLRTISLSEVRQHTNDKSCWIVIHNDVYDVTKFLEEHPGGADSLLDVAGKDGTIAFEDVGHSDDARDLMKKYKIGTLSLEDLSSTDSCSTTHSLMSKSRSAKSLKSSSSKSLASRSSYGKKVSIKDKSWRTFDDPPKGPRCGTSKCSRTSLKPMPSARSLQSEPRLKRSVSAVTVPKGRVRRCYPEDEPITSSNWWKYLLIALAVCATAGIIYKRQSLK